MIFKGHSIIFSIIIIVVVFESKSSGPYIDFFPVLLEMLHSFILQGLIVFTRYL